MNYIVFLLILFLVALKSKAQTEPYSIVIACHTDSISSTKESRFFLKLKNNSDSNFSIPEVFFAAPLGKSEILGYEIISLVKDSVEITNKNLQHIYGRTRNPIRMMQLSPNEHLLFEAEVRDYHFTEAGNYLIRFTFNYGGHRAVTPWTHIYSDKLWPRKRQL